MLRECVELKNTAFLRSGFPDPRFVTKSGQTPTQPPKSFPETQKARPLAAPLGFPLSTSRITNWRGKPAKFKNLFS